MRQHSCPGPHAEIEEPVKPTKIFVHDYAGHPFVAVLSRELARRGHQVVHGYFVGDPGPKGALSRTPEDAPSLSFLPIDIGEPYTKGNLIKRRYQDVKYGQAAAQAIREVNPDIVISCTTPTDSQGHLLRAARDVDARFVFWCQDIYSIAVAKLLQKRFSFFANPLGAYYEAQERQQMLGSDAVVLISDDFRPCVSGWGVPEERTHVIPNWGAIENIPTRPKDNAFSRRYKLHDKQVFLYSGTLGLKHNPALLSSLAQRFRFNPNVRIVVTASGVGVDELWREKASGGLDNLVLLGLQPIEDLPDLLGSADVFCAVIEHDAGAFSVPSKVLSYLCAGRAIMLAAPSENLASQIVIQSHAGLVINPEDRKSWFTAADELLANPDQRAAMGAAGRAYAERNFVISAVADRFTRVFEQVLALSPSAAPAPAPPTALELEAELEPPRRGFSAGLTQPERGAPVLLPREAQ
jgi:glycosyltransferase involved in cell wall biosynthesis